MAWYIRDAEFRDLVTAEEANLVIEEVFVNQAKEQIVTRPTVELTLPHGILRVAPSRRSGAIAVAKSTERPLLASCLSASGLRSSRRQRAKRVYATPTSLPRSRVRTSRY